MGLQIINAMGDAVWLVASALLGAGAMMLRHKLRDWREARLSEEWDPY
ncbi:MAG TPA: hypothetical protein VGN83_02125 [Falsiroseomonas sp.]|jgi:hypothetical protein|nr:hypothetical protein [Falsiroseomonas sp.]